MMDDIFRRTLPGDVWTLAGRSGTGKTALALHLMEGAWHAMRSRSLFFSVEMSLGAICQRMHDIEFYRANDCDDVEFVRHACDESWDRVVEARAFRRYAPEWLVACDRGFHISQLEARIRYARKKQQIDIVAVDYLQLIEGSGKDRREQVSGIARMLKQVAKTSGVLVLSLSQLSREAKDGTLPVQIHHLKESGDIEEASDGILGLWRGSTADHVWVEDIKNRRGGHHGARPLHRCGVYFREPRGDEAYAQAKQKRIFS
jgi:replicative DNA helicase